MMSTSAKFNDISYRNKQKTVKIIKELQEN
jgi:hypothetical protein